jgi:hypothetical protein
MNKNTPLVIYLSFKNIQKDIELFNWISNHSGKSNFIKDILRKTMIEELSKNTENYIKE